MTIPLPPQKLPDADLWEYYRARGLSPEDATTHVERRRSLGKTPVAPRSLSQKVEDAQTGLGVGLMQGMTLGAGNPIAGLLSALQGQGFRAGTEAYQQGLSAVRGAAPISTTAGNVAGAMLSPVAKVLPAPTGMLTGAVTGAALGGTQGLMEAQGSLQERLPSAGVGAAVGTLSGAVFGKLVKTLTPLVHNVVKRVLRGFKPGTPAAEVAAAQEIAAETAVRARLHKDGYPLEVIERIIQTMKTGKQIPTAPGPLVPVAQRPGETLVAQSPRPNLEQATFMRRGGRVRQDYVPTTGNRYVTGVDLGKGQTLPYYSRGGKVEQSLAPFPVTSPRPPGPNQNTIFADYLREATPQDLGTRLGTLRDMGIPLPPDAEAQIFQLLFGVR